MSSDQVEGYPLEKFLATLQRIKSSKEYEYVHETQFLSMLGKDPQTFKLKDTLPRRWVIYFGIKYNIDRREFWRKS
jgi:hypothetical protein